MKFITNLWHQVKHIQPYNTSYRVAVSNICTQAIRITYDTEWLMYQITPQSDTWITHGKTHLHMADSEYHRPPF